MTAATDATETEATRDPPVAGGAPEAADEAPARHATFARATARLRPARRGGFRLERVLLTLGGICIPVGVVLIIVGWWGSSHTAYPWEQNDYLISGGVLGLGLVVIGCAFYCSYWMTRQIRVTEAGNQQTLRLMTRLEAHLGGLSTNGSGPATPTPSGARAPLLATPRGRLLHRPDCPVLAHKDNLRSVDPDEPGFRPCQVCNPFEDL